MYAKRYIIFGSITVYFTEQYISRDQDTRRVSAAKKAQVCYSQESLTRRFQPLISVQPLGRFLSNSHILCPPYTRPYIPNLTEIG